MEIKGVPDKVKRSAVIKLINAMGLQEKDLLEFRVHYNAIEATVYARNARGQLYLIEDTHQVARHHIMIPVVEDDA